MAEKQDKVQAVQLFKSFKRSSGLLCFLVLGAFVSAVFQVFHEITDHTRQFFERIDNALAVFIIDVSLIHGDIELTSYLAAGAFGDRQKKTG
jgi:hypothetical protein